MLCQLRAADPEERRAVIALVGGRGGAMLDAINAAADDVLLEPLDADELRLRLALANRRATRWSGILAAREQRGATVDHGIESMPLALVQFHVDDQERLRVHYDPNAFQRMGLELPPAAGMEVAELARFLAPVDRQRIIASLRVAVRHEAPWSGTFELRDDLGGHTLVRAFAYPVPADVAGLKTWNVALLDVGSQPEIEHRIEQAATALRSRDDFLATVSHELRTPLTVILGSAQLLAVGIHGELTPAQLATITEIDQAGRQLLGLIDDILDYSHLAGGVCNLDLQPTDLAAVCRAAIQMVSARANVAGLTIGTAFDARVKAAMVDRQRFMQVLLQLLDNSIKFTPEGGSIQVEIKGDAGDDLVRLIVSDTGVGIAVDQQQRVFEPFVQLDSGTDRRFGGTGLGLALVSRLVQLHGGTIRATTGPTGGTRIAIVLPWPNQAEFRVSTGLVLRSAVVDGLAKSVSHSMLLVDPDPRSRRVLADQANELGHEIHLAANMAEAASLLNAATPNLVLLDIELALPARELIDQVRHHAPATPIVAITGRAAAEERQRWLAAGAADYLAKPIGSATLRDTIGRLCATQRRSP
jgi:signal transduction histidine kinase/CheY-like chemotaxis protein